MNKTQEALKMAIEQMNIYAHMYLCEYQCEDEELLDVINACKEALEQQEQEPIACQIKAIDFDEEDGYTAFISLDKPIPVNTLLYTHPAKQLKRLTDREIMLIVSEFNNGVTRQPTLLEQAIARAIEAKIRGE